MSKPEDIKYMASALAMARRGLGNTAPNPSVGAVLVGHENGNVILARAVTGPGGVPHGEPQVLEMAREKVKGATLYVTLEPCNHQGRTPPCTQAIITAGVKRVVIASTDQDERVLGSGIACLRAAGIEVETGVLEAQADQLNAGHFLRQTQNRPYTIVKMAVSKDELILQGQTSGPDKGPAWVTCELARQRGALLRAEVDAILVGTQTALVDDPSLTCRLKGLEHRSPIPVVMDKDLKLPKHLKLLQQSAPLQPIIVCKPDLPDEQRKQYGDNNPHFIQVPLDQKEQLDLVGLQERLAAKGITRLLVEGGPRVAKSFVEQDLVDEVMVFQGNHDIGGRGVLPFHDQPLNWVKEHPIFTLSKQEKLKETVISYYQRIEACQQNAS